LAAGFSQDGAMENSDVVIGESATMSAAPYFIGGLSINSILLADVCGNRIPRDMVGCQCARVSE
jgi:hypothetical protein